MVNIAGACDVLCKQLLPLAIRGILSGNNNAQALGEPDDVSCMLLSPPKMASKRGCLHEHCGTYTTPCSYTIAPAFLLLLQQHTTSCTAISLFITQEQVMLVLPAI